MLLVSRACVRQPDATSDHVQDPSPLTGTRSLTAYVLLGDPGLGKTEAFRQEADAVGGHYITARNFLAFQHTELQDSVLPVFIDGLDETRAGTDDGRVPLDNILGKLQQLRCHRFRLSCRAADWLGNSDKEKLQSLLPRGEQLQVLTLQPLTLADVEGILLANHGINDPHSFITSAKQHGLTDLLFNPQTLGMLATAVGPNNRWPATRKEVYEMACERLVQEHNEEHVAATRKTAPNQIALQRAVAYLCTIQLIADISGFTHSPSPPIRVVRLNSVPNPERLPLDEALASRLFKSMGRDVFAPVHRTVAEFLAARCLADSLQEMLTVRRVLALICGSDGGIVSSMRGLAGWLATMSEVTRLTLIKFDSLGVLLYGDARNFSIAEKLALMEQLGGEIATSPTFRWNEVAGSSFAALVTPEMCSEVSQLMIDVDRSESYQLLVLTLLEGLLHAPSCAVLTPHLLHMVRDASWWPSVRRQALKGYLRWVGVDHPSLRALLDDVATGVVTDSDDEILGALLKTMYPCVLSAHELPAFLHAPKRINLIGNYAMFWRRDLGRIDIKEVPKLLDAFAARTELRTGEPLNEYIKIIGSLLARMLKDGADEIPDEQLLNWLDTACGAHQHSVLEQANLQQVQEWLHARPLRYFSLLDRALIRYANAPHWLWQAEARLHGAPAPANAAAWWLEKAQATADHARSEALYIRTVQCLPDVSWPELEQILVGCEDLAVAKGWQDLLTNMLTCSFEKWGWKLKESARRQKRDLEAIERRDFYRARLAVFSLEQVPLDVLSRVAEVYEYGYDDIDGNTPQERLSSFFVGDEELIQAGLSALRNTIERNDLPSVAETLDAIAERKVMTLNAPALIGMELAYRQDHAFLDSFSDERLVATLVAHLVRSVDDHDTWVTAAVASRPQCMAVAMIACLTASMRSEACRLHVTHLFRDSSYAEVTRRCLLPLLAQFPLRARADLRKTLTDMLHAALTLLLNDELLPLIQIRLDAARVDGPQRACWLAMGLILDPDRFLPHASCYLQRRPPAIQHLADFLYDRLEAYGGTISLSPNVLALLIEHLAVICSPERFTGTRWVSPEMNRADLVKHFINDLSGRPGAESTECIKRLESLPTLFEWSTKLRAARAAQLLLRRDATYERPTWSQVCAALQQGTPSSPAEIAAVVNDIIEDMKEQVCRSDLNLNRQYWNADHHKRPIAPRHEELCRDTFAEQLRVRLERFRIACFPETHHVNGKRSDVWCTHGALGGVPIEIKLDRHPELWTATRGQLIERYVTDPRAKGRGIYVVLWFGETQKIPPSPLGKRPKSPEELKLMLEADLSEHEKSSVTIHVLDCSVASEKSSTRRATTANSGRGLLTPGDAS